MIERGNEAETIKIKFWKLYYHSDCLQSHVLLLNFVARRNFDKRTGRTAERVLRSLRRNPPWHHGSLEINQRRIILFKCPVVFILHKVIIGINHE